MGAGRSRIARDVPPRSRRRAHLSQTRTQARSALERHAIATGFGMESREGADAPMGGAVRFGFLGRDGISGKEPFSGIAKKGSVLVSGFDGVHSAARFNLLRLESAATGKTAGANRQPTLLCRYYESGAGGCGEKG